METTEAKAESWLNSNCLKLNTNKTQRLLFSMHNFDYTDDFMSLKDDVKLLGITFDNRLSWSAHISDLARKLSSSLFVLRRLRNIVNDTTLRTSYFGIFHSHISYGLLLWGRAVNSPIIFKLQKRAVRIICKANYRESCKPLFISSGILSLPCLYIFHSLIQIHKERELHITHSDVHDYNTRGANQLVLPRYRLTKSKRNSIDLRLYNNLPQNIKNLSNKQFKKTIKKYLLQQCFYSIDEFLNASF